MCKNEFTIRELAALEVDVDIYNDITDDIAPAFCGALVISDSGISHFKNILDIVGVYDESEKSFTLKLDKFDDWKQRWKSACDFFGSAAGYCSCENWDKWFEED